jgi:hypothetical protein
VLALLDGAEILASVGEMDETRMCYASAIPVLEEELGPDVPRVSDARKRNAGIRQH